ncbi:Protein of unknown function [Pyronema omphalodes CBS 100304]|uniref:Uncharacterized protein n=1 Tax=Pyronema omphalodes (strain CBS 100304) TaxID=1076935 RepID=U4L369_PYROM|nr:Protein of unknown function [Pyronema omphalodes CBS 100304]
MERRPTTSKPKKRHSTILSPDEAEALLIDFSSDEAEREPSFRWSSSTTLSDFPDANGIITPPSRGSTPRTSTSSINFQYTYTPSKPLTSTSTSISTTTPDDYTGYGSHGLPGLAGLEIDTRLINQEIFKTKTTIETTLPRGNCSGYAAPPIETQGRNRIRARSRAASSVGVMGGRGGEQEA